MTDHDFLIDLDRSLSPYRDYLAGRRPTGLPNGPESPGVIMGMMATLSPHMTMVSLMDLGLQVSDQNRFLCCH